MGNGLIFPYFLMVSEAGTKEDRLSICWNRLSKHVGRVLRQIRVLNTEV